MDFIHFGGVSNKYNRAQGSTKRQVQFEVFDGPDSVWVGPGLLKFSRSVDPLPPQTSNNFFNYRTDDLPYHIYQKLHHERLSEFSGNGKILQRLEQNR